MFTYLDPNVRKTLIRQGKLVKISEDGRAMDKDAESDKKIINILGPIPLPLHVCDNRYHCDWYTAVRSTELDKVEALAESLRNTGGKTRFSSLVSSMAVNSVLVFGKALSSNNPLIRVHSNCLTGDVFGSERCECGPQLALAVDRISKEPGGGMIIYMAGHEGRGIGLWAKAATYLLQDAGQNTYQANASLGLPVDSRDFSDAASIILYFLGDRRFRILTNNPKKIEDLRTAGLTKMTVEKHIAGVSRWNKNYLSAKREWGHKIPDSDIFGD